MHFPRQLEDLMSIILGFTVVMGALECLLGQRLWRFILALHGLGVGFAVGTIAAQQGSPGEPAMVLALGIFAGAVGAGLLAGIVPLGTFIYAAQQGALIAAAIMVHTAGRHGMRSEDLLGGMALAGAVAGIVAALAGQGGVIVSSSLGGGWKIATGIFGLEAFRGALGLAPTLEQLGTAAGLAILGMVIQFGVTAQDRAQTMDPAPETWPAATRQPCARE